MDYTIDLNLKSQDFRNKNGIGLMSPMPFKASLSKLNILTDFKPLDDEISGMVGKINKFTFILVNSNHSIGRQNFTIAHEFYHIFYDNKFHETIIDYKNSTSANEKNANTFASYLLLPDGLIEMIPENEKNKNNITISTLVKIEQYYQSSRSALLFRLKNLKIIDDTYIEKNNNNIINQAMVLGYDIDLYKSGNENKIIGDYSYKAKLLFDNGIISESNYIDLVFDININAEELGIVEES
ncbi:MAG: ImmA/IrrE family metallo-endopeptidase [Asgard group archaeon]|nr:ImmA/IrrE family metallo-endopeptidase [Asgard group archaeon]